MLEFEPVTIEMKEKADTYLSLKNTRMCEHCFTDLFIWAGHYKTQLCFRDDLMFVMAGGHDDKPV